MDTSRAATVNASGPPQLAAAERLWRGRQRLQTHVAEFNGVAVASEAEESGRARLTGMWRVGHVLGDLRQIGIENHGSIQFHLDR